MLLYLQKRGQLLQPLADRLLESQCHDIRSSCESQELFLEASGIYSGEWKFSLPSKPGIQPSSPFIGSSDYSLLSVWAWMRYSSSPSIPIKASSKVPRIEMVQLDLRINSCATDNSTDWVTVFDRF